MTWYAMVMQFKYRPRKNRRGEPPKDSDTAQTTASLVPAPQARRLPDVVGDLMNLQHRKRTEDHAREGSTALFGQIFTGALSVLAILISAASFYITDLIRLDDVKVFISGTLDISATRDAGGDVEILTITARQPVRMVFSNAGNRAVVINSVTLTAEQMDREGKYQACQSGQTSFELEPVQLKVGEIIIKEMRVSGGQFSYKPCDTRDSKGDVSIRVSPVFDVITPDNRVFPIGEPLSTASFGRGHTSIGLPSIVIIDRNVGLPAQTLYHRRSILGW
jgi:hypothetical protein